MYMKNYILIALLSIAFFSSCEQKEQEETLSKLSISANVNQLTRASKSSFVSGDEIGIFLLNSAGQNYNDCDCSFNNKGTMSSVWNLKSDIQLSNDIATVYAYYPYSSGITDLRKIPIESTSQTDYLVATPTTVDATNSIAMLRMNHALSLVKFTIKKDGYSDVGHITDIMMQGITLTGSFDVCTKTITSAEKGNESYKADIHLSEIPITIGLIAIPQNVLSTTALITIDGEQYSYKLVPSNWMQGKETTYTLSIDIENKTLVTVGSSTIDEWGAGGSYEGNLQIVPSMSTTKNINPIYSQSKFKEHEEII